MVDILTASSFNKRQRALVEDLGQRPFPAKAWAYEGDLRDLWKVAQDLGKDIGLYIDRRGRIQGIRIDGQRGLEFFSPPGRRRPSGLLGWRLVATDLQGQGQAREGQALVQWRYDSLAVVYEEAGGLRLRTALLQAPQGSEGASWEGQAGLPLSQGENRAMGQGIQALDKLFKAELLDTDQGQERGLLVLMPQEGEAAEVLLEELQALAEVAGVEVVGHLMQTSRGSRKKLGAGKVRELARMVQDCQAQVVIFNDPLSPAMNRTMSQDLGVKVLDKTALILDIFALRAKSREGKLQVELAQLNYLLPRLAGKGQDLSRLGGGVGTRGPGETQLETDRRHIRRRMTKIRRDLDEVSQDRDIQRRSRAESGQLRVALVGYTNAGKSSLINALAGSDLFAEDQVFATLDAATRLVRLDSGQEILMSDTVGFIRDLPLELLDAFKSTLEELRFVDVLLHVVDASSDDAEARVAVVDQTLKDLKLQDKKTILVFNKIDAATDLPDLRPDQQKEAWVAVSARTGQGLDTLKRLLDAIVQAQEKTAVLLLPFQEENAGRILAQAHDRGRVLTKDYDQDGVRLSLALAADDPLWPELAPYICPT